MHAITYLDQEMVEADPHRLRCGTAVVHSSRSPAKQTVNEDAAAVIPVDDDACVLVVADGLGGGPVGEQAARIAIESMVDALARFGSADDDLRHCILDGMEQANRAIVGLETGAATTIAVVEMRHQRVRPYHVGDSMILMVGQRGKVKLQTISHSPVGYAVESGVLTESQAMTHEHRHIVSNVIGSPDMRIEIGSSVRMSPRDTVLLASDGLFDNIEVQAIIDGVRKGPIEPAARHLGRAARKRMISPQDGLPSKPDDLTFVIFRQEAQAHRIHS